MNDTPKFGTAGLSDSYAAKGFDPQKIAAYTASFGLTAFEYQCGRGVRLAHDKAQALGKAAAAQGITLSVHAPYYISMSGLDDEKRLHSVDYLLQSCALVKALGGRRVVFHPGSCGKQSREAALEKALDTMRRAVAACDEAGYGDCILCPETMGKINQLGTVDEVLALCAVDPRITPCIDFGHIYARSGGAELTDTASYAALLDKEDEAEALFNEKMDSVADVLEQQPTGKTVAFFYITSSGAVNVRKSTDYVAKCVAIAGGDYVSFDESAEDNAQSTINIQMESFYHGAVDADVLIYNSIIDGELHTLDELVALDPLMADFKAVKSGNVWCLTKNFYQESLELSDLILDVNHALNDAPDTAFHFLTRMK